MLMHEQLRKEMFNKNYVLLALCALSIICGIKGMAFRPSGIWENAQVVYDIDANIIGDSAGKPVEYINKVIAEIEKHTCITFHEQVANIHTTLGLSHTQYFQYRKEGDCLSENIGYTGGPRFDIKLGKCKTDKRGIMRATLSALGVYYEHQRPDRNDHISVINQNEITGGDWDRCFKIVTTDIDYTDAYDLSSIMHGEETFKGYNNLNSNNKRIIKHHDDLLYNSNTVERDQEYLSGWTRGYNIPAFLSQRDKATLNRAYQCAAHCVNPPTCENDGYVDASCSCQCTPETYGTNCELLNDLDQYLCPDSGDKSGEGYLASPDYPGGFKLGTECYWMIKSNDPTQKLAIRVLHMDLEECWFDSLKIYTNGPAVQTNWLSCDPDDYNNYKYKWFVAETDTIYVQFRSQYAYGDSPDSGFRLQYGMGCMINGVFDKYCGVATVPPSAPGQNCYICTKFNEACQETTDLTEAMSGLCATGEICKVTSNYISLSEREYVIANARACEPAATCDTSVNYQCVQGTNSATCVKCCNSANCNVGYAGTAQSLPDWVGTDNAASALNMVIGQMMIMMLCTNLLLIGANWMGDL